jgi:predicted transposase/invertase (TIGR01784 family)
LLLGKSEGIAIGKSEGIAIGKSEGIAIGKNEGENKKQLEIAKKMKSKNMPIEQISEFTGLSKKEIEKL